MARPPAAYSLLAKMNINQLEQTRAHIDVLLAERRSDSRKRLLETMHLEARKAGFDINELFGSAGVKRGKAGIKYRHPKDASLTWSGRGRPSKWLAELVAKGHKREEFAV